MNPYRIYRDEWARAMSAQVTTPQYSTFVAMPFQERFSYRSREVLTNVIQAAIGEANRREAAQRPFAHPHRVDNPMGAAVITEEIVLGILESHIFIADVTFQNPGVLLETGIALGVKPNRQIILITQGSHQDLHFDVRNNNVISYNSASSVSEIANALIDCARHFEEQICHHITAVARRLSPDAVLALKWYAQLQAQDKYFSLHSQNLGPYFGDQDGRLRFDSATRELRDKDLLYTDYTPGVSPGIDRYGMHATEFGWAVITSQWPELQRPSAGT